MRVWSKVVVMPTSFNIYIHQSAQFHFPYLPHNHNAVSTALQDPNRSKAWTIWSFAETTLVIEQSTVTSTSQLLNTLERSASS